jgi:hypothetical protein
MTPRGKCLLQIHREERTRARNGRKFGRSCKARKTKGRYGRSEHRAEEREGNDSFRDGLELRRNAGKGTGREGGRSGVKNDDLFCSAKKRKKEKPSTDQQDSR